MSSVVTTPSVVVGAHCITALGQVWIGSEVILAVYFPQPGSIQLPAHPVGRSLAAIVGEGILGFFYQVVVEVVGASTAGIAEFEMDPLNRDERTLLSISLGAGLSSNSFFLCPSGQGLTGNATKLSAIAS